MPPINPTADQLANRLSPTASTVPLPTDGQVFKGTGGAVYKLSGNSYSAYQAPNTAIANTDLYAADGSIIKSGSSFDLGNLQNSIFPNVNRSYSGSLYTQARTPQAAYDQQYGAGAYNALPSYIEGDLQSYGKLSQGAGNNDLSFFSPSNSNTTQTSGTVNNTPNSLGAGVLPGSQPATIGAATGVQAEANNGGGQAIDYQLRPGETPAQYNERIAASNSDLPAPGTTSSTGVVNSASLAPTSNLQFKSPADTSAGVTGAFGSAASTSATVGQQQSAYAETEAQQRESQLSQLLQGLNTQEAGKAAYQNQANTNAGVDTAQATVNDLKSKLDAITNEAATIKMTPQQNEGVTTAVDTRERNGALQTNAIAALAVSSLLNAANNSLATAQAQANKAVALIFDPIEAQIKADTANLNLIKNDPQTTLEEKQQADAQLAIKDAQTKAIADQKQNLADVFKIATDAAAHINSFHATTTYKSASQALTAIQQAHTKEDALNIAASVGMTEAAPKAPMPPKGPTVTIPANYKNVLLGQGETAQSIASLESYLSDTPNGAQNIVDNPSSFNVTPEAAKTLATLYGVTPKVAAAPTPAATTDTPPSREIFDLGFPSF